MAVFAGTGAGADDQRGGGGAARRRGDGGGAGRGRAVVDVGFAVFVDDRRKENNVQTLGNMECNICA